MTLHDGVVFQALAAFLVGLLGATAIWIVRLKREVRTRRQGERQQRETEERLALLAHALHAANDCVTITDANDRIVYANEAFLRTYEFELEELVGGPITIVRPPVQPNGAGAPPNCDEPWETWRGELWNRTKSGRHFPVSLTASIVHDPSGRRLGAVGVARDITAEKQAEEALRASEARFRELVENANDAIFTVDREGYCRTMNRAGLVMSGCEAVGPPGMAIEELLDPEQAALARTVLRRVLAGETVAPFELTVVHPTGARVTVELALRAVGGQGTPAMVQGIARDVTARKELERQVLQSDKMQAIGQLAAGIAHDFNNLITVVLGNCHEAQASVGQEHAAQHALGEMRLAAERAAMLTAQLLAFTRQQVTQPRPLRLDGVIAETQRMLARLISAQVAILVEHDEDLGYVNVDPGHLQQILLNLSVNARDAMPDGGRLAIVARNVRVDGVQGQAPRHVPPGNYVRLSVSDTGSGMDEHTRAHLFEPFFTTKEVGKGTGLGLSTVYGIVQQSGAFIDVESAPGRGSTFTIYFPHVGVGADTVPAGETAAGTPSRGKEAVLLVEDERAVRELVSRYLQTQGYTVLAASSGDEALAACRAAAAPPALLITDVVMPGMNGPALGAMLRRSYPALKVLYLSGYADDQVSKNGTLPYGTYFQQKPFALDRLARRVREIIDAPFDPAPAGPAGAGGRQPRDGSPDGSGGERSRPEWRAEELDRRAPIAVVLRRAR